MQKVAESIVAILIDVQACAAHFVGKFTFRHARNLTQHFKQVAHFVFATPLPRAGNSQKGRVPGDLRAGGYVVIAHNLTRAFEELEHVGQQMNVALLHGTFLRGGSGTAGHAVARHVIVNALEVRRAVAVVIGHDLLANKVCVADGVFIEAALKAQLVFNVGHGREHVALAVRAHRRPQAHVDDMRASLGGSTARGHEQAVGVMPVVVQHKFRPCFAQGLDQFVHKARRANAGHVLETQNDVARGFLGACAHNVAHHAQHGFCNAQIVRYVKALGPRHGNGGLEDNVLAAHHHFGNGAHVFHMVQKVETTHNLIVVADHLAGFEHEVARLRRVAKHVGRAHQQLLEGFGRKAVPFLGFGEGVRHVGQHGHMKVRTATVFKREESRIVKVGAHQPVFGKAQPVARVGLRKVARGGIREMHQARIANVIKRGHAVALRVRRGLTAGGSGYGRQHRLKGAKTGSAA